MFSAPHLQPIAPRHFSPGAGLPSDRAARLAARKAFVDLKLTFMHTLQGTPHVDWLHALVRAAEEPVDLWLLRAPVLAALSGTQVEQRARRQMLRRGLDSVFPDRVEPSVFVPL